MEGIFKRHNFAVNGSIMRVRLHYVLVGAAMSLLGLACACRRGGDLGANGDAIPLEIDKPFYVDKYSNLFREVRYVALEETRNSIVGTVSKLEVTNDGDFIVFDFPAGAVFRFASDGRFLNNVGFRGLGGKEYVFPEDVKYDPFANAVLVYDGAKRSVMSYSVEGDLLSTVQLPRGVGAIGVLDARHLICYMNNDETINGDEKGTNYKVITREGLIEKEFGEFGAEKASFRPSAEHVFCYQQGRCLCLPPYSYTLFEARPDSLEPIATFDLSDRAIPSEWLCGDFPQFYKKYRERTDLVEISSVYETEKYYLLNLVKDRNPLLCFVRKDDGKVVSLSYEMVNDLYGMVGSNNLAYAKDDKLYFPLESVCFENRASFLRLVPENTSLKDVVMEKKAFFYTFVSQAYGSDAAQTYVDSLTSSDFSLVPGERELVEEMSKKNNPIIQVCMLNI